MVGVENECWATQALDTEEAVKALVLAKGLRRLMTSRKLLLVASSQLPDDVWELLQSEFDVVVRFDRKSCKSGAGGAKALLWSLHKWRRIVFLSPETMVVRACDEIFKEKEGFGVDGDVMVLKPNLGLWRKLGDGKILDKVEGQLMDEKYNVNVDLQQDLLAKDIKDLLIVRFVGNHPMEIICKDEIATVEGTIESGLLSLWKNHLDSGVAQKLSKLDPVHFNGLKSYLDKYRPTAETPLSSHDQQLGDVANSIAIVGMSCRFPGANSLDEFWKLLIEGRDAIRNVPEGRWTTEKCPVLSDDAKNSRAGFLNCSVEDFDGKFFGVSPMELEFMDPQQRLTLQVAWEALEDSGINPLSLQNTYTGVFGGAWRTDYREALQNSGIGEAEFFRSYLGNSFGVLTARISHCLGLTGPSVSTESGCSSSIVAVDLACKSLLRRETDLSLACGVNLLIHPFTGKTMNTVLAPDGHCKTFDASADGFGRAEGCGVLVLKRYADAVRDGDRVWGLIRGSAVVQEGASRSLGTPTKFCEALAMKLALDEAGVEARDVSYVETHGTGTPVGDPLEVAAVAAVYSEGRPKDQPLTIGSVKTNIGHTESCSGIAGIIKVVLSMQNEVIPPHKNFTKLNPLIDLDNIPAQIPVEAMEWKRDPTGLKPRLAGVSSFGITGTDAHAIVQEVPLISYPKLMPESVTQRPVHILALSGKNEEALEDNLKQYKHFLEHSKDPLVDIAHTVNVGRGHFLHRAAIVGKDSSELLEKMKNSVVKKLAVEEPPKICFLFTGQGSQYPGMAQALYKNNLVFKMHFDQCHKVLSQEYGIDIKSALWGSNTKNLSRTIYSQTSIFCIEYCLLKLWASWGIKPDYVLGHSLGEFAAAVGASILKFEDALKLVAERSRLIDALPGGKMLVMKESKEKVDILLKKAFEGSERWLDYAAVNSPEQTVVAGSEENILAFAEFCKNNQIKTHILDATHAFHSRHMDPILEEYRSIASTVEYSVPSCLYVSGMEGRIIETEEGAHVNADYWVRHTRDSVRFSSAAREIMGMGCNVFLEVGPQPVLSALTMINSDGVDGLIDPVVCLPSIRKQEEDWSCILTTLAKLYVEGMNPNWEQFDQFESVKKLTTPYYPFQSKPYWFELPDRGPGQIHPLVGTPLPNASALKLYENQLELENAEFLRDHVIGNKVIFPGAGFMEMCLVAGHSATTCGVNSYFAPTAPITLESFAIESPLGLSENEKTSLQAIVTSDESTGDTKVTVYSKLVLDKETQKWIRHASATFSPYAVNSKYTEGETESLEQLKAKCSVGVVHLSETYGKLAEFGLKFGTTFQTLSKLSRTADESEVLFEVNVTQEPEKYICHPVVMDALFQAIMITAHPSANKLHVPVSVEKFISYAPIPSDATAAFIHCKKVEGGEIRAVLLDAEGQLLALMEGASLMETTVSTIMSALEAQKLSLPSMYEDVWRPHLGPFEKRAELDKVLNQEMFDPVVVAGMREKHNGRSEPDQVFFEKSNRLYGLYMIKGLYELGLIKTNIGDDFVVKEFAAKYKVLPALEGFLRYTFMELAKDGYFVQTEGGRDTLSFKLVKPLPTPEQLKAEMEPIYKEVHAMSANEVEYVSSTGSKLANMLTGRESALPLLFPEDPSAVSAEAFYMTAKMSLCAHASVNDYLTQFFKDTPKLLEENKETIRILEVGAGTGSYTKTLLHHLTGSPSNWEYTYTDISAIFFPKGQKVFEGSRIKVHYKILNIEDDPASQGFIPGYYDIIIANNVIHATKSIPKSSRNLRNLLRPGGVMLISESVNPNRATNLTFGLLDAYWHYSSGEDFELRGFNCEISEEKWDSVLKAQGFSSVASFPTYETMFSMIAAKTEIGGLVDYQPPQTKQKDGKVWFVFEKGCETSAYVAKYLRTLGNQVICVRKSEEYKKLSDSEYLIRYYEEDDMTALIHSVTKNEGGPELEGIVFLWGLEPNWEDGDVTPVSQPFLNLCKTIIAQDHPKLFVVTKSTVSVGDQDVSPPSASPIFAMAKCFQNEQPNAVTRCIDLEDTPSITETQLEELCSEFLINDHEIYVAYRGNQRVVPRFVPWKPANTALSFPKSERFRLLLPASNAISDLRFGAETTKPIVGEGQIEARVKSYALNFRDLFAVIKPSPEFENMNTVGIDWSGVVTAIGPNITKFKVGDEVFASNLNGAALPSHVVLNENIVMPKGSVMTFNEAATIPAVAATAYLCLIEVAKLTKDDTILIHTASGGVGIVAVQIAKAVGATIVATAGNKRKRAYLRNTLGLKYIFHSRNTSYGTEIRKALGGRGVSVVLNSLTSPGFKEASLSVCDQGAKFIEMSKLNTWTPEEVKEMRPDVEYTIVDLSSHSAEQMSEHVENIRVFMNKEIIKPIPYCRFDASEIREALTFLQKAKHVGKIVLTMPDPENDNTIPMFTENSTYLITGGLGGIGMEIAKWMVGSGAKNVALVGRSAPNEKAVEEIRRMNMKGKNVFTLQYDVGDEAQCRELLEKLGDGELPPLRGVMHAAGVLSDAIYSNQTWEKYCKTYNPKVKGGWNLHKLTMERNLPLEHFVMFSSAVASLGSMGQSNHASANFFLDSLANYRHYCGLPATTVNWGQWGQVGVAANIEIIGLKPFTALQGISALERVMKSQRLQACVCEADFGIIKQVFSGTIRYVEELKLNQTETTKELVINNEQFWNDYDSASDDATRLEVVKRFVRSMIRQILKLSKDEPMNDDENFQDLGMDSLMMIEMKNVVQSTLGKRATITVNSVKDCHTVTQLATRLCQLLSGDGDDEVPVPTREELLKLIREDAILPESLKPASIPACKPSEVKTIFITGVTGNMGPYFLRDLSHLKQITKIYCLVREDKNSRAQERLERKLGEKGLLEQIDMSKLEIIPGLLSHPLLGLSPEVYEQLASSVDCVVHLAVKSNLTDEYKKVDKPGATDIRTMNVKGTLNVLNFVTAHKNKVVLHASTIVANASYNSDFTLTEDWPAESDFDDMPSTAYPVSKFVCDRLMGRCVEELGLPIKVFRFPAVGGESCSGANVDYENNQLMLRMMSYLHLGMMPAVPIPYFILPVDICVNLALRVFFDDATPNEVYNVYNPYAHNETELVQIGEEMGYRIEIVEPDVFQDRVEGIEDSKLIHFLKEACGNKDAQKRLESPAVLQAWTRNPTNAFVSKKLTRYIPEYPKDIESTLSVIKRDLMYAKESGIFSKFGI